MPHILKLPRRASGHTLLVTEFGSIEGDTLKCVHCPHMWQVIVGSGIIRGWCRACDGPHCGGPNCWRCDPWEAQMERAEAAARKLHV